MGAKSDVLTRLAIPAASLERREAIILLLKASLVDKQETSDGYVYAFPGDTDFLRELMEFISLERQSCPFFKFELTIRDEKSLVQLKLTGPDGTKDFLKDELGL